MTSPQDEKLQPNQRVAFWFAGTVAAGVLPLICVIIATAFTADKPLTWAGICSHGDFLIIGAALVIGAFVELIVAFINKVLSGKSAILAGFLAIGGIFLLVAQLILYPLILSNALKDESLRVRNAVAQATGKAIEDPTSSSFFVNLVSTTISPILFILAVLFGIAVVRLSLGRAE